MTKKVRIGNDIRMKVRLSFGEEYANILSVRAIFINKTLKDKLEKEYLKKNRFIGRFPIEPFVNEFEPDAYNINSCGCYPKYKAYVVNEYSGFGVYPDWKKCAPVRQVPITEVCGKIQFTTDAKTIIALFPAKAQLYTGVYDMLIVADVLDDNYPCGKRTVSAKMKEIFELVEEQEDAIDNPVQIEIDNPDDADTLQDIYVVHGQYNGDSIDLVRNDNRHVNIEVQPWYEEEGWNE